MEKVKIEYTHNNSVVCITLDDGKGNVLDNIMMNELNELFDDFSSNENLKLITFEGAGKHFSFGASVEEHTKFVELPDGYHPEPTTPGVQPRLPSSSRRSKG